MLTCRRPCLFSPFNPLTAPGLIQHVRDCIKGSPRNLYCNIILTAGPIALAGVVIIQMCYIGSQAQGAEYLSAIASWNEERCLFKDVRERSFIEQQDSIANVLKGGAGRKWLVSRWLNSPSNLSTLLTLSTVGLSKATSSMRSLMRRFGRRANCSTRFRMDVPGCSSSVAAP